MNRIYIKISISILLISALISGYFLLNTKNDGSNVRKNLASSYLSLSDYINQSSSLSQSSIIFSDTFDSNWQPFNWGSDFRVSSVSFKSTGGLEIDFKSRWSGMDFRTTGYNTKDSNVLYFAISPESLNLNDLYVYFYTENEPSLSSVQVINYLPEGNLLKNNWYEVVIPLADLKSEDLIVKGLIFESASVGKIEVDEIKLLSIDLEEKNIKEVSDLNDNFEQINSEDDSIENDDIVITKPLDNKKINPVVAENIYLDELLSGWYLENYSNVNLKHKSFYDGQYSLNFQAKGSWGELIFLNKNGIKIDSYDGVWMVIKRDGGNENIQIIFYDEKNNVLGRARIGDFVQNRKLKDDTYMESYIPFRIIFEKKNAISKIVITSEKPSSIFIDNFKFTGEPSSIPFGGYYSVVSGPVFKGELLNGWHFDSWDVETYIVDDKGPTVLKVLLKEAGAGLYFKNLVGLDTKIFKSISFNIKAKVISENNLSLTLYDTKGNSMGSIWINDFINYDIENEGGYQNIKVKFNQFEREDKQNDPFDNNKIGGVLFSSNSYTDFFYLDDLKFE